MNFSVLLLSKNFPTYPWNIPQTQNQQFMKEFLSFVCWGFLTCCNWFSKTAGGLSKNAEFAKLCPPSERRSPESVPRREPQMFLQKRIQKRHRTFVEHRITEHKTFEFKMHLNVFHCVSFLAQILAFAVSDLSSYLPSLAALPTEAIEYVAATVPRTHWLLTANWREHFP